MCCFCLPFRAELLSWDGNRTAAGQDHWFSSNLSFDFMYSNFGSWKTELIIWQAVITIPFKLTGRVIVNLWQPAASSVCVLCVALSVSQHILVSHLTVKGQSKCFETGLHLFAGSPDWSSDLTSTVLRMRMCVFCSNAWTVLEDCWFLPPALSKGYF